MYSWYYIIAIITGDKNDGEENQIDKEITGVIAIWVMVFL